MIYGAAAYKLTSSETDRLPKEENLLHQFQLQTLESHIHDIELNTKLLAHKYQTYCQ